MPRSHVVRQAWLMKAAKQRSGPDQTGHGAEHISDGSAGAKCAVDAFNAGVFPRPSQHQAAKPAAAAASV
ncbi:hypothetical protein CCMA1212_000496 [Trichoderma ghanense]|uniref:Uncharacterized protein n=1 Tax=Trichoderma ghanense TaxID=65468 RepID=A0ABY2HFZ1_9HYPO